MDKIYFSNLPISEEVKKAVAEMGFEEATSIQTQSIPLIIEGKDVIGHSQTGTGKTAAFGIPVIERISLDTQKGATQALILCPTRELAIQACEETRKFAKYKQGIRVVPIYGGQAIDRQIKALKQGAEIVIGTPGRIMDHMRRKTLKLQNLSMIVLDEADEMLNMGFREDIETILQDVPKTRQTILFSATMPPAIMKITQEYQNAPVLVKIVHRELTVPNIKQYAYECPNGKKIETLSRLLDYYNPTRSIVFCNTKRMVEELVNELDFRGFSAAGLHGDMKQQTRSNVMSTFKNGRTDILVATDVAARGIDVDDVDAIFNFDLPQDEEYYVHRIGRTGRAGKNGTSHTLVNSRKQIYALRDLERYIKTKIEMLDIPTVDEVKEIKSDKLIKQLIDILEQSNFHKYESVLDRLMERDFTSVEIACAALQMISENSNAHPYMNELKADDTSTRKNLPSLRAKPVAKTRTTPRKTDRKERQDRPMTRLIISAGKRDKIAANHIVAAIAGASGLPGDCIGNIEIYGNYTFVEIPTEVADKVIQSMKGCTINKRPTTTEIVKKPKRHS